MCSLTRRFVDLVGILRFGNEYAYIAQLVKKLVLLESLPDLNFEAPEQVHDQHCLSIENVFASMSS